MKIVDCLSRNVKVIESGIVLRFLQFHGKM